jgi:FkbM family methyltransferase
MPMLKELLKKTWVYTVADTWRARRTAAQWTEDDAQRYAFYSQFVEKSDVVFDIGANLGNRTRVFRRLARAVVAVEPQDECMANLRKQFGGGRRVKLVKKAVGTQEGLAEMLVCDAGAVSSLSSDWIEAVQTSGRFAGLEWNRKQTVEITTLDRLIDEFGMPSFIKIDVEGYEYEVLSGLTKPVKALSFEFTPEYLSHTFRCIEHLSALGEARFNYSLGETMQLSSPVWVSREQITVLLSQYANDHIVFGDVYARFHA